MRVSSLFVVFGAVWIGGAALAAQGAQAPTNLQVLPKTWTRQQVNLLMQTFNRSLGVQCAHCHAEDPNAPPPLPGQNPRLDYALDTKPEKDKARNMIKLVMNLNETLQSESVSCFTCHREATTPDLTPPGGWGRGVFTLSTEGPVPPPRGGGAPPAARPAN